MPPSTPTVVTSTRVYVRNLSDLQLPRIIALDPKGVGDLLPGAVGPLLDKMLNSNVVNTWMRAKRLEVVTEQDYIDYVNKNTTKIILPADENKPPAAAKPTKMAKPIIEKLEDGSTAITPGYDEIPEADELLEPTVANLDKDTAITLIAPKNSSPLTEEPGDAIELPAKDLRPRILDNDGSVKSDKHGSSAVVAPIVAAIPAPKLAADAAAVDAEKLLAIPNWRKQKKAIEECTSVDALKQIATKVTSKGMPEVVKARIEALSKV